MIIHLRYKYFFLLSFLIAYFVSDVSFIIREYLPIIDDYLYGRRFPTMSKSTTPILIVEIDDETVKRYGYLPYKRSSYGEVISRILEGKPKVLGIDIFFYKIRDLNDDIKLVKILENAKSNVVLAYEKDELDRLLLNQLSYKTAYRNNDNVTLANAKVTHVSYNNESFAIDVNTDTYKGKDYLPFPFEVVSKYLGGKAIHSFYKNLSYHYTLINYTDRKFPSIPFWKVKDTEPAVFKDKIVLIAATSLPLGDIHQTPISKKTPGTYILAYTIDMLLNGNFIVPIDENHQKALTFLAAFVTSLIALTLKRLPAFFVTIFSIIAIKLVTDMLFHDYLIYMYFVPFLFALLITHLIVIVYTNTLKSVC
ncbi:CHASE2 domain-containing protein [Candidatus Magnetomonas plexicatena]|uniref:CHASE2 domain-containing protein n=1 Tax=Candidatus Magnetomonas plexicatena TaxID=2552947 RepID=UPI001102593D|nr:CHASE2 domain-containing protein [Nitrospirales bacterium LBB_01]